ncbi:Reverse transcriptase, partial [Giardia duodenalis]
VDDHGCVSQILLSRLKTQTLAFLETEQMHST